MVLVSTAKTKTIARTIHISRTVLAILAVEVIILLLLPVGWASVWAENLFGTSEADTIVGSNDDDNIFGQEGNDNLRGEAGDDHMEGHAGNDIIDDGPGSDNIWAGSGDDRIILSLNETVAFDEVHGQRGQDYIDVSGDNTLGLLLIYAGSNDDNITAGDNTHGRIYGGSGDDRIQTGGDSEYDAWGGPGNDFINGASECTLVREFGGPGNDILSGADLAIGGLGNDIIDFADCDGVAYGGEDNDQLSAGDYGIEAHGDNGDDILAGAAGEVDLLFGDAGNDRLTGGGGGEEEGDSDSFSCGSGIDTITDFNPSEGDTKTADCENF